MLSSIRLSTSFCLLPMLLSGCASVSTQTSTLSEAEYNALATKAASNDARNFCDDTLPGRRNTDQEYVDCYYSVLEQRGRYFRGELEGQSGRPPVSELLEASVTPQ
jgi:uncharacterized protein YceK